MSHQHDYWEGWRRYIIPKLGKYAQALSESIGVPLYVHGKARKSEFVGRVQMGEEEFEKYLHEWGFDRNPLASLKKRMQSEEIEEGSFRKIYPNSDPEWQLHVILYDGSQINNANTGEVFIYAHWEYRWDVYPWKHYRAVNKDNKKGVMMVRDMLDEADLEYEFIQP